ncbi:helix-turn-helix transcriptional regulator [Mycolicibacterium sp. BiH015]|uniref:helix-turn-helix transcriptional regulator n=1 Tax=Mycolicibacterium sp. BiH015 TaxID=3018808 RepID=UPI0022E21457|nr:helix-turn-helix transcriptional regulator [Mycolicibacterium sp. BiH015]MDA2893612.1 helix-turn-helix transcriptional regulator [Mycolicibacterium sp. BiH015]
MSTFVVDTEDPSEAESVLSAHFAPMSLKTDAQISGARTRFTRCWVGPMPVDRVTFDFDLNFEMDPWEKITLVRVRSGRVTAPGTEDESRWLEAGDVAVFGTVAGRDLHGCIESACLDMLSLDRTYFDRIVAEPGGRVQFTSGLPASDAAGLHVATAVDYVVEHVADRPFSTHNPLIVNSIQRYVACCMLAAFPNTGHLRADRADRHDDGPAVLRSAIAYIEENAEADITTSDVADAVYVTPRALQYMFNKHRDCTPTDYMRRVRLHRAHLDLVSADRGATTVGHIARRWGFLHSGRFAVYYREHYGQSPHVTLRNGT